MLRMLIVEDERLEREGLLNFLDWKGLGIDIVDTAVDGIEGLEKAGDIRPDIIITDIKMPGLNGLAMSQKIKEFLPGVKIIILTGYDDFKMAREAIGLQVNAYILKPLEEEEVLPVLKKTIAECLREKERLDADRSVREQLDKSLVLARTKSLTDLLEGRILWKGNRRHFSQYGIRETPGRSFTIACIQLVSESTDIIEEDCTGSSGSKYQKSVDIISNAISDLLVFSLEDAASMQIILCLIAPAGNDSILSRMEELYSAVCGGEPATKAIIGLGCPVLLMDDISMSYSQAKQSVEYGMFWSAYEISSYDRIEALRSEFADYTCEFHIKNSYFSKQLVHAIRMSDDGRMSQLLAEMFSHIESNRGAGRELMVNCMQNLINEASIVLYNANRNKGRPEIIKDDSDLQLAGFKDLHSMENYIAGFFRDAFEYINGKKSNKDGDIVKKVIELIEERYMSDISLKMIAGEVYLSPNYLGTVFRKYTGSTFNDHLCGYRMEKARELLSSPRNKVNWVAEKVGIRNISYFCTLFKSRYGMAPGEYQETFLK